MGLILNFSKKLKGNRYTTCKSSELQKWVGRVGCKSEIRPYWSGHTPIRGNFYSPASGENDYMEI